MDTSEKVRANRLRAMAKRQGLQLVKSRARDPRAITYDTWAIRDLYTDALVAGDANHGFGLSLDDVEHYLTER